MIRNGFLHVDTDQWAPLFIRIYRAYRGTFSIALLFCDLGHNVCNSDQQINSFMLYNGY